VQGNHSGQWGLASILLSSLVVILFPMMLLLLYASLLGVFYDEELETRDIGLGIMTLDVLCFGLLVVAAFALLCGVFGLATALFRRQSFGLSLAGTVTAVFAVTAAGLLLLGALRAIEWTRTYESTHYGPDGKKLHEDSDMRLRMLNERVP
jgi:hypothetical protein